MPWIRVISFTKATGLFKQQYEAALQHADRIWNIVAIVSQNPTVLKASMAFYSALIHGPLAIEPGLARTERRSGLAGQLLRSLKVIKRVSYGRAKFDLLRRRVLAAA